MAIAVGLAGFQDLTSLSLSLPCTHDFVSLDNATPASIFPQLRHLRLEVTDSTGPGRSQSYLHWADEDGENDDDCPFFHQLEYPNIQYAYV